MNPIHPLLKQPVTNPEIVPVRKGGVTGKIGYFGLTRVGTSGEPKRHNGVDLLANERDPVYAAHDGVILRAGWQDPLHTNVGYGLRVYLQDLEGKIVTVYAHLAHLYVKKGQQVAIGDLLGLVGHTGNVGAGPIHLHFEVRRGGLHIDPLPWLVQYRETGEILV